MKIQVLKEPQKKKVNSDKRMEKERRVKLRDETMLDMDKQERHHQVGEIHNSEIK